MHIEFEFYGDEQVVREIMRPANNIDDLRPLWPFVVKLLTDIQREQFATEGGRSGRPWQELEEATIAQKGSDRILIDTGALFRSWTNKTNSGDAIRRFRKDSMDFAGAAHGAPHHHGKGHLPVRKVVDLVEGDKNDVVKLMQRFVMTGNVR